MKIWFSSLQKLHMAGNQSCWLAALPVAAHLWSSRLAVLQVACVHNSDLYGVNACKVRLGTLSTGFRGAGAAPLESPTTASPLQLREPK